MREEKNVASLFTLDFPRWWWQGAMIFVEEEGAQPPLVWERDHMHKLCNNLEFRLLTGILSKYCFTIYCFIDFSARRILLQPES